MNVVGETHRLNTQSMYEIYDESRFRCRLRHLLLPLYFYVNGVASAFVMEVAAAATQL